MGASLTSSVAAAGLFGLPLLFACSYEDRPPQASPDPVASAGSAPVAGSAPSVDTPTPPGAEAELLGAACDPSREVEDNLALLVQEPETLARFSLERVLSHVLATAGAQLTPAELLQRVFDTENTGASAAFADGIHCDDADNPAFAAAPAVDCPRAEGRLARSTGLLTPGAPDSFVPIAIVNRFDLTPANVASCGEYRIVYAKLSGRTDPADRVLLIIEAVALNPERNLSNCRAVAELWASLPSAPNAQARANLLETFFFAGVGRLQPVLHASHLGSTGESCDYAAACGQLRVGQGMQEPWQFRQFRLFPAAEHEQGPALKVVPTTATGTLRPAVLTEPPTPGLALLSDNASSLAASDVNLIRGFSETFVEAGESAVAGPAAPDYEARLTATTAWSDISTSLAALVEQLQLSCPPEDPLTPESLLRRGTALSCAGCHAPEQLIASDRKVGCGVVWPGTDGKTHIDEHGQLSSALVDVFLPHRARVLSTFLRACDVEAIQSHLQPVRSLPLLK